MNTNNTLAIDNTLNLAAWIAKDAALAFPVRCMAASWPWQRMDAAYYERTLRTWRQVPILELGRAGSFEFAVVGPWIIYAAQETEESWNTYSRSWHVHHGPKVTVIGRTACIRRYHGGIDTVEQRDQPVSSWRGHWALDALISAGVVQPTTCRGTERKIQGHPAFALDKLHACGTVAIYARTLAGDRYDYAAVREGVIARGDSPRAAMAALRRALAPKPITWDFAVSLGFCPEGIREFCRDFGLQPTRAYSWDNIRAAIDRRPGYQVRYLSDLGRLAKALHHSASL